MRRVGLVLVVVYLVWLAFLLGHDQIALVLREHG